MAGDMFRNTHRGANHLSCLYPFQELLRIDPANRRVVLLLMESNGKRNGICNHD